MLRVPLVLALSLASIPASADRTQRPDPVVPGPNLILTSSGSSLVAARETAGPDTFVLYGGPDHPTQGKFQLADRVTADWGGGNGLPGGYGGGPGAWTPVDLTEEPVYWHQSTFNAENLNSNGAGNHALWSGIAPGDPLGVGYESLPGYGNNWYDIALYESEPLADPSVGQVIDLDFFFNYDLFDETWDFFLVQYEQNGIWVTVYEATGVSRDASNIFQPPGVQFSAVQEAPIVYSGNDYGGTNEDRIRIRFLVTSDGAWSDEDGNAPTLAGAAQVDDITLTTSHGTFTEDFEGEGPYLFRPYQSDFAGDFAEVYPLLTDVDVCRDNPTPVVGFIDYGQDVRNGPDEQGRWTTHGSNSIGIEYGISGNYVVNYTGGLSHGTVSLENEIWSPEILWDLPGAEDDDTSIAGATLQFDVWVDLPLLNGMFYAWHVRSDRGSGFGRWEDRNFIYFDGGNQFPSLQDWPAWFRHSEDVTDLLQANPVQVQVALGVWDYAGFFGLPGLAATPAPVFDNVRFSKHRLQGPAIAARRVDLAQEGFPASGTLDVSTLAGRDALDIPFSMARDVNSGMQFNVPGDSILADIEALIPGTVVVDIRMVWALDTNPLFEDAIRAAPARTKDENVVAGPAGSVWNGEVMAEQSVTSAGAPVYDRYFFDLPAVDFMYPGDVLHYYIRTEDNEGRVSTLPRDVSGFGDFSSGRLGSGSVFDRTFRVRGLPTLFDTSGEQPQILIYNGFGRRGGEEEWLTALGQLGLTEGAEYDTYTVMGPTSTVSNRLGSAGAHGATVGQLAGYEHLIAFFGNLTAPQLSDGSNQGANDKSDDLGLLQEWHALPGPRNVAYFGDNFATGLEGASVEGSNYLANTLGVDAIGSDAVSSNGGQTAPLVVPNEAGAYGPVFATDFVAFGGCDDLRHFDHIRPLTGAEVGHYFTDVNGVPISHGSAGVASVIKQQPNGLAITFPFDPLSIYTVSGRAVDLPARASLLEEVLSLFGLLITGPPVVDTPAVQRVELGVAPNPINPSTVVSFTAAPGSRGSVKVYNLRGELVRTLHSGEFDAQEFRWEGADDRGAPVASGVYLIRATDGTTTQTEKVALVK